MGNLYRTKDQTDRIYQKGGKLLKDEKYHYLYDRNGNLKLKTQRKVGQHQLKIREEEVSKKPKKFSFFVEEVKEEVGKKDLEYYLRNDRKYTQAEKEEYKRLKAEKEKEQIQNDEWQKGDWAYEWNADGSLKNVKLPNGDLVQYEYDALGRRTKKIANGKIKRYFWDGNVLLHEWEYDIKDEPKRILNELGEVSFDRKEPVNNLVTWVYEIGSFVPCAKIVDDECYSIISDYIGRPIQAYDDVGNLVWSAEYDIYGGLKNLKGDRNFVPFRQLGQYEDCETGLYYNRFRYYDSFTGLYISKDPIGLLGGFALYGYVFDSNKYVDIFGLELVDPNLINFSQRTINRSFDTPTGKVNFTSEVNRLKKQKKLSLKEGNIYQAEYPAIKVAEVKGQLVVIDGNSRLSAIKQAKLTKVDIEIVDDILNLTDLNKRLKMNGLPNTGTSDLPTCK